MRENIQRLFTLPYGNQFAHSLSKWYAFQKLKTEILYEIWHHPFTRNNLLVFEAPATELSSHMGQLNESWKAWKWKIKET